MRTPGTLLTANAGQGVWLWTASAGRPFTLKHASNTASLQPPFYLGRRLQSEARTAGSACAPHPPVHVAEKCHAKHVEDNSDAGDDDVV